MHVIQLLDKFCFGGGERVAITYNQSIKELGLDASILAIKHKRESQDSATHLVKNYFAYIGFILTAILENKSSPTWLISHSMRSLAISCLFKVFFFRRVKLCFVQHLFYSEQKLKMISRFQFLLEKLIQISPLTEQLLKQYFKPGKLFYFNNYIHPATYIDSSAGSKVLEEVKARKAGRTLVTFVGAVKAGKNAGHIVDLAARLPKDEFFFLLVGDGDELAAIKERAKSLGLDNLMFAGYQEQPLQFLQESEYFFFSSYNNFEMMPMAVLEAKSNGCIVLAYDLEINTHIVPEGNIFPLEDFDAIAKAIISGLPEFAENEFDIAYGHRKFSQLLGM